MTSILSQIISPGTKAPADGCNMRCRTGAVQCHITTAEPTLRNRVGLVPCLPSSLLTFVVCFSLMIILDSSTTHIGIVALTVKKRILKRTMSAWELQSLYFLDKHKVPFERYEEYDTDYVWTRKCCRNHISIALMSVKPTPLSNKLLSLRGPHASIAMRHQLTYYHI